MLELLVEEPGVEIREVLLSLEVQNLRGVDLVIL